MLASMCAIADTTSQAQAIREATQKSLLARDLYSEQVAHELTLSLETAQEQIHKALLAYKSLSSLPDSKLAAVKGLEKLDAEIGDVMKTLKKEQTLMFRKSSRASFRSGVYHGIGEFAAAQMPFYRDLTPDGIDKLTTSVFTLIDTDALDFMANYNLVLAGDVHRELSDGIKRTILSGIATGKGADDIVRDLGRVVEDKESFRNAGSKVFSKAQYRMEMIARTEVLRAHNQGRIKFHMQVGVQKLEWLTMEDERMCPVCGELDGKQFDIDHLPNIPAHPQCRCALLPAWPLDVFDPEPTADPLAVSISADPDVYKDYNPTASEFKLHDEFWEHDGKIIESLSPSEHWSLRAYIRQMCNQIVSQSRGTLNDPKIQQHVNRIKAILDRSELSKPIRVYRGDKRLPNDPEKAKEFVGKKLENPGFLSTSIRAHIANQFSTKTGGIIEVDLPEGIHALYAGAFWRSKKAVNCRKQGYLGECEILLPPGIDFEITSSRVEETALGSKVVYTAKPIFKPEHMITKADLMRFLLWTYAAFGDTNTTYLLSPRMINDLARQKADEQQKLKRAFASGNADDLNGLTVKQLQSLAKQYGIAVARTKIDIIKILDKIEPGVAHSDLSGAALQSKIQQYNIAALCTKDELVRLLVKKQVAIRQAKEAAKKKASEAKLSDLTMTQLRRLARQYGVSLNLTKSEVIEMLDRLEPGVDHIGLGGKALLVAKRKFGIPALKDKGQLVKALEKAAIHKIAQQ